MAIPKTASTVVDKQLRSFFPYARATTGKHWPCSVSQAIRHCGGQFEALGRDVESRIISAVTIRNPFARAVSCWKFLTKPNSISFSDWLDDMKENGFTDNNIEARPQWYWARRNCWHAILRVETLDFDFAEFVRSQGVWVPIDYRLPVMNAAGSEWRNKLGYRTTAIHRYADIYSEAETVTSVIELYTDDFKELGYSTSIRDFLSAMDKAR